MARAEWTSTARALADQFDDNDRILPVSESRRSDSPIWSRRSVDASQTLSRPQSVQAKWMQTAEKWNGRAMRQWAKLSSLQKGGLAAAGAVTIVLLILFLVYSSKIFAALEPIAEKWRNMPGGWLILWLMTFFVSFPPMIGYSTCVTIAGFVFGMKGWFVMATATVVGSTASFIASRSVLKNFVSRMTEKNKEFAALSLVLKHDGLKLLIMIRLCPLPYSFANGAISTIPTVTWQNFMLATAIASPKLLLHIFVGSRIGALAEGGDKMDTSAKIISYLSIIIGMALGVGTGYVIYTRTKARAKQLEADEAAAATTGRRESEHSADYNDDLDEREATNALRSSRSDISLHTTYADEADLENGYRDEFTDDEDAHERDVFDVGDGDDDDDDNGKNGRR
ncbi:hypothetical protein DOTSEDRAFT_71937 [Dothistroma septosporum NZE10]|uniref:Golgi apparatus membrane protein TVP38 n=1 Tax=Dothistroma septosporum (strain NZE10 / CBS 128990) TaxID=675120 RepID=N1PP99_DOTSN|nr:hypothetical protein DOTSEDRAFT_71937 [Dothistroma septosporum NZE10]